jgi:MSHA biogenesis protein MshM
VTRQNFYFSDGPYLQAMQGLHSALSGSEAFVKFIGQPRTGKSGVCEKLTQFMRLKDYRVIYFDYPVESPDMLRSMLAKKLDIPDTFNILRHMEDALVDSSDKPLIIIFDDAHLLSDITLIEIYRLVGVQVRQKRIINCVLCGEPELERRLSSKQEFNSLLQHVSHNFLLEPMNAETTLHFLAAFLEKMGMPGVQLAPAASNQFYKACKGFPGPAYSLCQLVLSIRQNSQELDPISKEELLNAIRSADSEEPVQSGLLREGNRWMLFGPVAAVIVIASLALLLRQLNPQQSAVETEGPALSPFAVQELAASPSDNAIAENIPAQEVNAGTAAPPAAGTTTTLQEQPVVVEEELPVSDSNLALVTAQERGISTEVITQPLFEQMTAESIESDGAVELPANDLNAPGSDLALEVRLTRPMLALDDEDIVEELPDVQPDNRAQQRLASDSVISEPVLMEIVPEQLEQPEPLEPIALNPQEVVQGWLEAWEGQDLEKYFAAYDEGFVPRYHSSRSAWRSDRERVIGNASQISLELSDFELIVEDDEMVEVHFWLSYRSPTYRDETRKKLILKKLPSSSKDASRLTIVEEINLEVRV